MTNPAVTVVELIQEVKKAVQYAEQDGSVKITCIELDVKTVLERTPAGEFKWKVLTLSGSNKHAETQTLNLKLEPTPPGDHKALEQIETLKDDLITAINAIKSGVNEAERTPPRFTLQAATVEFSFSVTDEGKIVVLGIGAGGKSEEAHSIKLTLNKPKKPSPAP